MTLTKNHGLQMSFQGFTQKFSSRFTELTDRGVPPCPMCTRVGWKCLGYYETPTIAWDGHDQGVTQSIPLECTSCGFIAKFAMRAYNEAESIST